MSQAMQHCKYAALVNQLNFIIFHTVCRGVEKGNDSMKQMTNRCFIDTNLDNICPYVRSAGGGDVPNFQGKMRKIYDHQLIYCCSGEGLYIHETDQYEIDPGSIIMIKPNTPHTIQINNQFEYLWVHFDFFYREDVKKLHEYVRSHQEELFCNQLIHSEWIREEPIFENNFLFPAYIRLEDTYVIETLFKKLLFEYQNQKVAYQLKCKSILLDIISEVIRQIFEYNYIKTSSPHYRVMYQLISYMEQNYFKKISLGDLSRHVNLSGDYISRIFKKETGSSAMEYLNCYRIKKAKELLAYNDLKVQDVAAMVGYQDIHYFSRVFKKLEGISPSQYHKVMK